MRYLNLILIFIILFSFSGCRKVNKRNEFKVKNSQKYDFQNKIIENEPNIQKIVALGFDFVSIDFKRNIISNELQKIKESIYKFIGYSDNYYFYIPLYSLENGNNETLIIKGMSFDFKEDCIIGSIPISEGLFLMVKNGALFSIINEKELNIYEIKNLKLNEKSIIKIFCENKIKDVDFFKDKIILLTWNNELIIKNINNEILLKLMESVEHFSLLDNFTILYNTIYGDVYLYNVLDGTKKNLIKNEIFLESTPLYLIKNKLIFVKTLENGWDFPLVNIFYYYDLCSNKEVKFAHIIGLFSHYKIFKY